MLDVDGTLLDRAHRITPATHAAVQRARRVGLHVLLASGRSPRSLRPYLSVLGLEGPAVAYTGALTFRLEGAGFRTLAETPMPRADAAAVLALAGAHGIEVGWYLADGWRAVRLGPAVVEEAAATHDEPSISPALPDGAPAPHKLICMAPSLQAAPALHDLRARLPAGLRGQFSHPRYLEVTAAGVDKAHAVRAACSTLGVEPAELAVIGDQENDLGMLRQAGVAIAMGNATPAVIAAADRVTASHEHDGVALAIAALLG